MLVGGTIISNRATLAFGLNTTASSSTHSCSVEDNLNAYLFGMMTGGGEAMAKPVFPDEYGNNSHQYPRRGMEGLVRTRNLVAR